MTCDNCGREFVSNDMVTYHPTVKKYVHTICCPESSGREAVIPLITVDIVKQFLVSGCGQSDRQKIYEFLHNSLDCRMR